jgi:hypothetical protein
MDRELEVSYKGVAIESEEPRHSPSPPMSPFESMSKQQINPSHYKQGKIEVIDFIIDQKMDYLTSNVCKYICRWRFKDGVCDLKKAKWYLDKLIEQEEGKDGSDPE